ncbi:Thermoresistant gluconokinase [Nitrospira japonica]|uniref:Gluconokinase n=2 Tax=Nitrospira japonica TaxID=1325564 RepID=A0A1W1I0U8_9BACT|nr:Thermoresistant gluconokinase [Nitrospira japonica]
MPTECRVIIVMGVAGAGKTTVGLKLARELNWTFIDGDSFHSRSSIEKMAIGQPLTDADRFPWLDRIRAAIDGWRVEGKRVVLACSLLKAAYRDFVLDGRRQLVQLVYLKASPLLLHERLLHRAGHFMKAPLLESQLETLEEPEDALLLDAADTPEQLIGHIRTALHL